MVQLLRIYYDVVINLISFCYDDVVKNLNSF